MQKVLAAALTHKLVLLAAAGAAGTLARYAVGGLVHRICGASFPWGTLVVNVVGCLLFGIVWPLAEERLVISGQARLIVLVGFMGAFTTFSTYAFESAGMLADSEWRLAALHTAAHNLAGIAAVILGLAIGRKL